MLTLDIVCGDGEKLLPEVRRYAANSPSALLDLALARGPIGGCNETFSPIYAFDVCKADCSYCGFRTSNEGMRRTALSSDELAREAAFVKSAGCDVAYVLGGSLSPWDKLPQPGMMSPQAKFAANGIRAVRDAGLFPALEMSPFSQYEFAQLANIARRGRYVLFQETYDPQTYLRVHWGEKTRRFKGLPDERVVQPTMALAAGWQQVGIGAVLGLAPDLWRDVACVLAHARILLDLGAELVTISVPRLNPALGAVTDARCDDEDFIRAVAIISLMGRSVAPGRIKVVITGRETPQLRDLLASLTDIWGIRGSTTPGGYVVRPAAESGQFELVDRRTLAEIRLAHTTRHAK